MNKGAKTEREARRQREQTLPPILKTQKPKTPTTRKLKLSSQTQMHGPENNPVTRLRTRDNNTLGLEEKRRKKNPANPPSPHPPRKKKNQKLAGKKTKTRKDRKKEQPKKTTATQQQQKQQQKEMKGREAKLCCDAQRERRKWTLVAKAARVPLTGYRQSPVTLQHLEPAENNREPVTSRYAKLAHNR
jgi:hypothetical protein